MNFNKAVIIHEIAQNPNDHADLLNQFIVKCTVLSPGGDIHPDYDHAWFPSISVSRHLQKSNSNLVVNQLVRPIPQAVQETHVGKI